MTPSALALLLSEPVPNLLKKKPVLLVDTSPRKRDLRAETMRKLEFGTALGNPGSLRPDLGGSIGGGCLLQGSKTETRACKGF